MNLVKSKQELDQEQQATQQQELEGAGEMEAQKAAGQIAVESAKQQQPSE